MTWATPTTGIIILLVLIVYILARIESRLCDISVALDPEGHYRS
jgi:hypothetical protein